MRQGAVVILRRDDGTVLMQHRDNNPAITNPDYWALPGGAVDKNEGPKQAAIREMWEETNYQLEESDLTPVCEAPQIIKGQEVTRHVYLVKYDGQPIQCLEGRTMEFVNPNSFKDRKVFEDHVGFIQQGEALLSGRTLERRD